MNLLADLATVSGALWQAEGILLLFVWEVHTEEETHGGAALWRSRPPQGGAAATRHSGGLWPNTAIARRKYGSWIFL